MFLAFIAGQSFGADLESRLKALEQQNQALQQKLQEQQTVIDDLAGKVKYSSSSSEPTEEPSAKRGYLGEVRISGEGGVGIFHTGNQGRYSNADFRVDEAKLFIEAPLWESYVFTYIELDLMTRERATSAPADDNFHLGEAYVDFESVSRLWNRPGMLGIRIGRLDVPFGEEYLARDVIDNPLISHSLSDFWGIDEGIAFYGAMGPVDYVFAVQNGGHPSMVDYNRDKSLTARIGWKPTSWLRVSGSAMRTGDLDTANDKMSEMWFGNGFFRAIGTGATLFEAAMYEGDVQIHWKNGHLKGAGGFIDYSDNAIVGNSDRQIFHYYAELLQRLPSVPKLYGATRVSQIMADGGVPIVGHGSFGTNFYTPSLMTDRMIRWSVGAGYEFSEHLKVKVEYTLDHRHTIGLPESYDVHFLGAEIGFAF